MDRHALARETTAVGVCMCVGFEHRSFKLRERQAGPRRTSRGEQLMSLSLCLETGSASGLRAWQDDWNEHAVSVLPLLLLLLLLLLLGCLCRLAEVRKRREEAERARSGVSP